MTEPVPLGDLGDLEDGELRPFPGIGPAGIVVCRVGGALHAIEDRCSHANTTLHDGRLRGAVLTCPLHGAQFDVRDGRHLGPPAYMGLPCHRVEETSGGAVVHLATADGATATPDPGDRLRTR